MAEAELRAYFVWVPMLPADDESAALLAAERFAEQRATHYWDPERHLARRIGRALGIRPGESIPEGDIGLAWDVYLAYGRGEKNVERPNFWMHQLALDHAPRFELDVWLRRVRALLRNRTHVPFPP